MGKYELQVFDKSQLTQLLNESWLQIPEESDSKQLILFDL
jgi:hypothetical protein